MQRKPGFHSFILDKAFENADKKTVIEAYVDALNYDEFNGSHLIKVLESQEFENQIDHFLNEHIRKQAEKKGFSSNPHLRLLQASYFYVSKGYLSVADLIVEVGKTGEQVPNSEFIKKEFFTQFFGEQGQKIDDEVRSQILTAVKGLRGIIDEAFYGLEEHLKIEEPQPEPLPEVPVAEEAAAEESVQPTEDLIK